MLYNRWKCGSLNRINAMRGRSATKQSAPANVRRDVAAFTAKGVLLRRVIVKNASSNPAGGVSYWILICLETSLASALRSRTAAYAANDIANSIQNVTRILFRLVFLRVY